MAADIGSAITGLAAGIGLVKGAFTTITGVIEDTARATFEFNQAVVDNINDLNDLNAQSALTAQSIQAVEQAFVGSGQSAGAAAAFISRFPRLMADLEAGAGRASEAAEKLGIEFRDATTGEMKDSDHILKQAISRLQAMESDTERTTTAFLLFGRSAGQLLQAFGKTAEFEKFLEFSTLYGTKTGPEASAAAARFQELISGLEIALKGAKQALVDSIGGIGFFNNLMFEGIKLLVVFQSVMDENKEETQELAGSLLELGKDFVMVFGSMIDAFKNNIAEMINFVVLKITQMATPILLPIMLMEELGILSSDVMASIDKLGVTSQKSAVHLENMVVSVSDSIQKNSDSAEKAGELLEGILAGIDKESSSFKSELEALQKAMEGASQATSDMTKQNVDLDGSAQRLNFAMDFVLQTMDTFDQTPQVVKEARENVRRLQNALKAFEEAEFVQDDFFNVTARNQLIEAQKRLDEAIESTSTKAEQATMSIDKLGDQISGFITNISDPRSLVSSLSGITEKIGSSLSGLNIVGGSGFGQMAASGAGSALTAAAPLVGAIVSVVTAIEGLGKETPKSLKKQFDNFVENFEKGARLLPTLIADILPVFLGQLLVAIGEAAINLSYQIPRAIRDGLFEFIVELTDQLGKALFGWLDRIKEFFANFGDFFANIFSRSGRRENRQRILGFESGGRFVPDVGMRFTGSGFADEGMAMLHRGETVVPESNRRSQAVDRSMNSMGGGVTVVVNADIVEQSAIDELVRRIEERFQGFGGARSTLFGV